MASPSKSSLLKTDPGWIPLSPIFASVRYAGCPSAIQPLDCYPEKLASGLVVFTITRAKLTHISPVDRPVFHETSFAWNIQSNRPPMCSRPSQPRRRRLKRNHSHRSGAGIKSAASQPSRRPGDELLKGRLQTSAK